MGTTAWCRHEQGGGRILRTMRITVSLKKAYEFSRVYKRGKYYAGKHIILYVLATDPGGNKIGVTASKKVGKSVVRNRMKRLVKENYRAFEPYVYLGYQLVFVIRNVNGLPTYHEITREMKYLFKRAGVLDLEKWEKRSFSS